MESGAGVLRSPVLTFAATWWTWSTFDLYFFHDMSVRNFITYNIEALKISSTSLWRHWILDNPAREKQPTSHVTLVTRGEQKQFVDDLRVSKFCFVIHNKRVAREFKSVQITTTSTHVPHGPEHILTGITRKPCFLICFITYTPNPISITDSIGLGHLQIVFNQQVFGIHSAKILHFEKIALDIEARMEIVPEPLNGF